MIRISLNDTQLLKIHTQYLEVRPTLLPHHIIRHQRHDARSIVFIKHLVWYHDAPASLCELQVIERNHVIPALLCAQS